MNLDFIKQNKQFLVVTAIVALIFGSAGGLITQQFQQSRLASGTSGTGGITNQTLTVQEESATTTAVEKVSPSVVSIIITKELGNLSNITGPDGFPFDDFFEFNLPGFNFGRPKTQPKSKPKSSQPEKREVGGGTGFFITEDGLILTNKHVVIDEQAEYTVLTNDGKRYPAKVLARDPFNDIAVVKVDAKDQKFKPLDLGDSDKIKIGETVIAIGNSLGEYRNTVTKGVISGIGRKVTAGDRSGRSEVIEEALQTDAAINPGNSGGPLINLSGQVIGVNTAVNLQGQLIGFAIPINQAKKVIDSVKTYGRIIRPFLGVRYLILNDDIAKKNNLSVNYGALVARGEQRDELAVTPGSPADKAGIVENDIILEADGVKINLENHLAKIIGRKNPGDTVELKILHRGDEKIIKVKLEEFNQK